MKKITHILPMIVLAIITTHNYKISAAYKNPKRIARQQARLLAQQRQQQQQLKGGGPAQRQTTPVKSESEKKQQAAALDKKIQQKSKQLADAVKQEKQATTPEEEAEAKKRIIAAAKNVLLFITEKRNLYGELLGYSGDEIEAANAVINELENKQGALQGLVNELKKQQKALQVEGWRGWMLGSVKPGKETEYEKITKKINKLEPTLTELNNAVRNQKIIGGNIKLTKTRAFAAASLTMALGAAGAYAYLGPVAAKAEYDKFKNNPREYLRGRATDFKNMVSGLLSETVPQQAVLNATGTALTETWTKYLVRNIGQATTAVVTEALTIGKNIAIQATLGVAVTHTIAKLQKELMKLIEDPNPNKEKIEQKAKQIINLEKEEPEELEKTKKQPQ